MPSSTSGFSGNEIVSYIRNWTGNQDSAFQSFLESSIPLWEYDFCKLHDWKFLNKQNLSLTVTSGTDEYTLDSNSIGYYMAAEDVKTIFSMANGIYLKKITLDQIRRLDPEHDDGSASAKLVFWAPSGDNKIVFWPPTFADTVVKVDGKITPIPLQTLSNYPTVPYRYQSTFMEYCIARALEREADTRSEQMLQNVFTKIRQDIQNDNSDLGDTDQPRIKSMLEQAYDGSPGIFDPLNQFTNLD